MSIAPKEPVHWLRRHLERPKSHLIGFPATIFVLLQVSSSSSVGANDLFGSRLFVIDLHEHERKERLLRLLLLLPI